MKSWNDTFPLSSITRAEADAGFGNKNNYLSNHDDVSGGDRSFQDQIYMDDKMNSPNSKTIDLKLVDIKVNQILWSSFMLAMSFIFASLLYGLYQAVIISPNCAVNNVGCIDNNIPTLQFLFAFMLPGYLVLMIDMCFFSVLLCEVFAKVGTLIVYFYIPGKFDDFKEQPEYLMFVIATFVLSIGLQYCMRRRMIFFFHYGERLSSMSVNQEREFMKTHLNSLLLPRDGAPQQPSSSWSQSQSQSSSSV